MNDIITRIDNGEADDCIRDAYDALRRRQELLAQRQKNTLQIGDRVRFTNQARNFAGSVGVVERKLQKNVVIKLDDSAGNRFGVTTVRSHPSLLEVIS